MLTLTPVLDADCLIKILRGENHEVLEFTGNPFAYLSRGDLLPWEINKHQSFYEVEIRPLFESIGLDPDDLEALKKKYCTDRPASPDAILN